MSRSAAPPRPALPTFGITGGIGSGKSAVAAIIERAGIPVCSADQVARSLSASDPALRRKITALLGPQAYRVDGSYDRAFVASQIFSDRALQRSLEEVVHPATDKAIRDQLREWKKAGHPIAAVEAALVFEAGMDRWLQAVLFVDAPEEVRVARVMQRDGVDAESVRRRIAAQGSQKQHRGRSTIVIENDGTLKDLGPRVQFALSILRTMLLKG
ncbi:MAG: dephospho-CoA kinase [Bacteroidetes bacterium]|nr:dephospho-CoA kinase [Bacteroidota bacterium]